MIRPSCIQFSGFSSPIANGIHATDVDGTYVAFPITFRFGIKKHSLRILYWYNGVCISMQVLHDILSFLRLVR